MAKHPADGLYDFSYADAERLGACREHLDRWHRRHGYARVPITFADMLKQYRGGFGDATTWLLEKMCQAQRITIDELRTARGAYWASYTDSGDVEALMNCLLVRAKREGRV